MNIVFDTESDIALPVCRLSSGSACNFHGTKDCTTTQCNCLEGYIGELCQFCDWHNFYFVANGTEGQVDAMTSDGVKCASMLKHMYFFIEILHS